MFIIEKNRKLVIYIGQYESIFMITNRANNGYKKRKGLKLCKSS